MKVEKASEIGLCFGVKRAIGTLEKVASERGEVETLGAVAHNQQVLQKLAEICSCKFDKRALSKLASEFHSKA